MYKYENEIVHLGNESLLEFISKYNGRIVIYGMGDEGSAAYYALQKRGIGIAAIADGSKSKQGSKVGTHIVLSLEKMIETIPRDCLVCVAVGSRRIVKQIVETVTAEGFESVIHLIIKDPIKGNQFSDFRTDKPIVIVGINELARKVKNHLIHEGARVLCFCDVDYDGSEFEHLPVKKLEEVVEMDAMPNVIICKDGQYRRTILYLVECGIMDSIYRGVTLGIGEFKIHKYEHINRLFSEVLLFLLSHTNQIYYSQKDESTRMKFRAILEQGLDEMRETYSAEKNKSMLELLYDIQNSKIETKTSFYHVETKMEEFITFLAVMKKRCVDDKFQVHILQEEHITKVI